MNTNTKQITDRDLDNLLDISLDDIADLPEFTNFPPGAHTVSIKLEKKVVNNHPCVELGMTLISTEELADPTSEPVAPGSESSVLFMLDNEFGAGKFKKIVKPLAESLMTTSVKEVIEHSKGMECLVVTSIRKNKEKTQSYMDIVSLQVV